jgi:hypothetical protein
MVGCSHHDADLISIILISTATFTKTYLQKHQALLAGKKHLACSICGDSLNDYASVGLYFILFALHTHDI